MARKVIDIIYNLVRRRLAQSGAFDRGPGITSLPDPKAVESGMQQIFKQLKEGGYNVVSADKVIKNEEDLLRVIEEINQKKIAQAEARKKFDAGITRVFDKMKRNIPLNPDDQAALQGSGFKTALDNFKGFEPRIIEGGKPKIIQPKNAKKDIIDANENLAGGANYAKGDTKYNADVLADEVARARGLDPDEIPTKDRIKIYGEAYDYLTEFNRLNKPKKPKKAKGGIVSAVKKLRKKYGKDIIQKGKAPKDKGGRKKLRQMFKDFEERTNKKSGGIIKFLKKLIGKKEKTPSEDFKDYLKRMREESDRLNKEFYKGLKPGGKLDQDIEKIKEGYKFPDPKEMKKRLKEIMQKRKLERFDVEGRKPNAGGGLAYMLGEPREEMAAGGPALRRLLQFLNKGAGKTGSQGLREMKLPKQVKFFAEKQGFDPDQIRINYLEQVLESLKADRKMMKGLEPDAPSAITGKAKSESELMADDIFKKQFLSTTQEGRFKDLTPEMIDSSIMELEGILKNLKTKGRKLNADGGRIGFADGGMSRRTFLKIMAALASFPLVGKLAKTTRVAKGVKPIVTPTAEMPAHFPKLVEKILREGQVVKKDFIKKTGDVTTYKHPDRPDIELTIEGDGKRIQLDFETDQGMKGGYEFRQGDVIDDPASSMRGKRGPDEFTQGEVKYRGDTDGNYYKDFEEGIDTGTENLDAFAGIGKQKTSKSKVILNDEGEAVVRIDEDLADGGLAGLLGE